MILVTIRTIVIYLCILAAMRFMGKRQLGELQPSELASTILISNLASISIESTDIPLLSSLIPLFLIAAMEILLSALCFRFPAISGFFYGHAKPVIKDGHIDTDILEQLRLSPGDLLAALREKDVFDPRQVSFAQVETNGKLTVCKYPQEETVTKKDLAFPATAQKAMVPLIISGMILEENLAFCGKDKAWLADFLQKQSLTTEQICVLLGNDTQTVYCITQKRAAPNKGGR